MTQVFRHTNRRQGLFSSHDKQPTHISPPSNHNGGPPLEDLKHTPPWGRGGIKTFFEWKKVYQAVWKSIPRETIIRRLEAAKRCGVTYEEYSILLLNTGRYLQPSDTEVIAAIIKVRRR